MSIIEHVVPYEDRVYYIIHTCMYTIIASERYGTYKTQNLFQLHFVAVLKQEGLYHLLHQYIFDMHRNCASLIDW